MSYMVVCIVVLPYRIAKPKLEPETRVWKKITGFEIPIGADILCCYVRMLTVLSTEYRQCVGRYIQLALNAFEVVLYVNLFVFSCVLWIDSDTSAGSQHCLIWVTNQTTAILWTGQRFPSTTEYKMRKFKTMNICKMKCELQSDMSKRLKWQLSAVYIPM